MFLHINKFKRLMKDAYNAKLEIGNIKDGLVLHTPKWTVWIQNSYVPNPIKGFVMEHLGFMPKSGDVFEIYKKMPMPKKIEDNQKYFDILEGCENAVNPIYYTGLMKGSNWYILQDSISKNLFRMNETIHDVVSKHSIDLSVEGEPTGPCYADEIQKGIYWSNSVGIVMIMPELLPSTRTFMVLSNLNFNPDDGNFKDKIEEVPEETKGDKVNEPKSTSD